MKQKKKNNWIKITNKRNGEMWTSKEDFKEYYKHLGFKEVK